MKNRQRNFLWVIVGGVISFALIVFGSFIIGSTTNNPETFRTCFIIMSLVIMCVYLIITIVKMMQYKKWLQEYKHEMLDKTKKTLDKEFKTVLMNDSCNISKEKYECKAKIDDDGKIVCKIHLDMETKLDSYEEFQKYFHFTEK